MSLLLSLEQKIKAKNRLIVSCQPVDDGPMDRPEIVAAMALAAQQSNAIAVRIEGIDNLKVARPLLSLPIIGIVKRDLADSPVRISPWLQDIDDLAEAGADIIAFDATDRVRPVAVAELVARIHAHGKLAMADSSTLAEGLACQALGVEFIGTTMSGYTTPVTPKEPDLEFVSNLAKAGCRVIAEGRYNTPELAAKAIEYGAWSVTVGSALTRLEHVCEWFDTALQQV